MPIFAGLFLSVFTSIITLLGTYFTKKTATTLAAIGVFTALVAAFTLAIAAGISSVLSATSLPSAVLQGMASFMPANLPFCVGAVLAAEATAAVYRWNRQSLMIAVQS